MKTNSFSHNRVALPYYPPDLPSLREVNGMNIVSQSDHTFNAESCATFLDLPCHVRRREFAPLVPHGFQRLAAPMPVAFARANLGGAVSAQGPYPVVDTGQASVTQ